MSSSKEIRLDMYMDADFVGMFNPEDSGDPTSVKVVLTDGQTPIFSNLFIYYTLYINLCI